MDKKYTFDEFNINEDTLKALGNMGFEATTEVQSLSLYDALEGHDLLIKSQTGTGKTAIYAVTFTERAEIEVKEPQCLVLTPTRELAIQVAEEIRNIGRFKRLKVLPIYGGQEIEGQKKNLRQRVHAVVGTPGRILDHIGRGNLDLSNIKLLVVDEVDVMYDMGFIDDIKGIIRNVPVKRQTMMFSATISEDIELLAIKNMKNPIKIEAAPETVTPDFIEQQYYGCREGEKFKTLYKVLSSESDNIKSAIIFCNTKKVAVDLSKVMKRDGIAVNTLHGDMTQDERILSIKKFKQGNSRILIATDVAARGLDIENVSHVINYDIPRNYENYIHRVGRTGRAGRRGIAITLVLEDEKKYLDSIESAMAKTIMEGGTLPENIDLKVFETVKSSSVAADSENRKDSDIFGEILRLHINAGRKDKIRAGDIVGAIVKNSGIDGQYIGVIDIYDNYSFVEIMEGHGIKVLEKMSSCNIKKKKVKITLANDVK